MEKNLVSVITPIYNMEKYLAETIHYILTSDYENIELVLMDDGSTDSSLKIAQAFARRDSRVKVLTQPNGGVIKARNNAIRQSNGEFILPVDADDLISIKFIGQAVDVMNADPDVKVVYPRAEFMGDRYGEWHLPKYSPSLLARKNMIPITAMYRRSDWDRVGGYCEEIVAREDWEFWISILKDGGKVARLMDVGLYYRIRKGSKRTSDRKLKRHVVDTLNKRHADFFQRQLGGPLHYHRSWSRLLNRLGVKKF